MALPPRLNFAALRASRTVAVEHVGAPYRPWLQAYVPRGYVHRRVTLPLRGLPPELVGLRLLHVSDFHLGRAWGGAYDRLIELTARETPDLILMTGDFVEDRNDHRPAMPTVRRLFTQLRSVRGTYAILGNHDPDVIGPALVDMGIRLIQGRRVTIEAGERGGAIELIGLPGVARSDLDPAFVRAQPLPAPGVPRITLCHYPDLFAAARALESDLYLAGHTHGGQVCLPGGWPILTHDRMPRAFSHGVHRVGDCWFVVSRGMGFTGIPVRLFCPTEVTEIRLAAQA